MKRDEKELWEGLQITAVVDDSIGRLITLVKSLISPRRYAPARKKPRTDDDGDEDDEADDSDDDGDGAAKGGKGRKRRRSEYTSDSNDMATTAEHAAGAPLSTRDDPTNFYETDEFLHAEALGVPLFPLFARFAEPVIAWFMKGASAIVCCLDKGTVRAKARTGQKRAETARKRREFPFPDSVRMTKRGSLYDEKKVLPDGKFEYVRMDYNRLMLTRRLRNEAFEWFAHAFSKQGLPSTGVLYLDYADNDGKHPVTMEIRKRSMRTRSDLVNSCGEGDVAIVNWLNYFSSHHTLVSAIDGDMFGILTHYVHSRAEAKKWDLDKCPVLYWSDHAVFRNMNVFVQRVRALGTHPLAVALLCILSVNDFFMPEDKKKTLNQVNEETIWTGLLCVPLDTYTKFGHWLDSLHNTDGSVKTAVKDQWSPTKAAEMRARALTFVRTVQAKIIAPRTTSKSKTKTRNIKKGREQPTIKLSDLIVGNIEYWYYGKSRINPVEFTGIVGLEWRAVTRTQAELDQIELADCKRV